MNKQTIIIVAFLLSSVFGIGLVFPQYQTFKLLQKEVGARQAELQSKEEYFSNLKKISDELKGYEAQISKIDSILPSDPGLPALFNFIQNASSQAGVILKGISPSGTRISQAFEGIQETELSLILFGSYSSFKNFLSILEKTSRLIEIKSISFSSAEQATSFNFNLKTKVYSY